MLGASNRSVKPVKPQELMFPALIDRIAELYPRDQSYYERAVQMWDGVDIASACALDVPRLY
jgi:hypothetical protein